MRRTPTKPADDREKEFQRALRIAQQRHLIGAIERDGTL
jgi:hypothetical protein